MSGSPAAGLDPQAEANAPSTPDSFSLLVKNPTDRPGAPPFALNVQVKSTVRHLKELLESSYPGSPPIASQRLIYAGKLLDDSHLLETVMNSTDPSAQHIVHLVVSSSHRSAAPVSASAASSAASPSGSTINANVQPPNNAARTSAMPPRETYPMPGNQNDYGNPLNPYYAFHRYNPTINGPRLYYPTMPGMLPHDPVAYQMPYPPHYPSYPPAPSDSQGNGQPRNQGVPQAPFAPVDPAAYAAHLQMMERIIAEGLAAQQNSAQESVGVAAAQGAAAGADGRAAAQAAASGAAAAAAMHAQAHVQAMAHMDAGLRAQLENNQPAQQMRNPVQGPGFGFGFHFGRGHGGMEGPHQHQHQHPNQGVRDDGPRVRRYMFQFEINWVLISKLIFVVYLLGQEGSPRRVYTLMALALTIYLWQTNRLGFLRRLAGAALPNPVQLFESLFPQENLATDGDAEPSDTQPTENRSGPRAQNRFGRAAVILCFVYSFFYGFVSSLLPAWRPQPLPRMEEVLNAQNNEIANNDGPEAAAETDGVPNDQHEHAD